MTLASDLTRQSIKSEKESKLSDALVRDIRAYKVAEYDSLLAEYYTSKDQKKWLTAHGIAYSDIERMVNYLASI